MNTIISTFSGCGGSSLGYKLAGFKELLAIDFNQNSVDTFKLNFPEVPVWMRDITEVKAQEILDFCKIKPGELDILDGSPPCQGFSMSGKRRVMDPRNRLFESFTYLIKELQPKVFVMENVPGQVRGTMKGLFKEILASLKGLGYEVKVKIMNAKYYQVPQARQRLIYIGVRKDLNKVPSFPIPSDKVITVKEALEGLKDIGEAKEPNGKVAEMYYQIIPGQGMDVSFNRHFHKSSYFNVRKLSWYKPSFTVTKTFSTSAAGLLHPKEFRFMTINEIKRLCSFPDSFQMTGSFTEQWNRLGNAVMPNMMKAIALNIKDNILN